MSSKHILGIGQLAPGKVVIIHGNTLECDHAKPIATLEDCEECLKACGAVSIDGHVCYLKRGHASSHEACRWGVVLWWPSPVSRRPECP